SSTEASIATPPATGAAPSERAGRGAAAPGTVAARERAGGGAVGSGTTRRGSHPAAELDGSGWPRPVSDPATELLGALPDAGTRARLLRAAADAIATGGYGAASV